MTGPRLKGRGRDKDATVSGMKRRPAADASEATADLSAKNLAREAFLAELDFGDDRSKTGQSVDEIIESIRGMRLLS